MHLNRLCRGFIAVITALFMTACGGFFTSPVLQTINVTPPSPLLGKGTTLQLAATGVNDDGSTTTLKSVSWSSSDNTIATVDNNGVVKALAVGRSTITAMSGTISGTTTIAVVNANVVSIAVTPANATVAPGQTLQFTATARLADGSTTDITKLATWTSSNTSVVTIDNQGLATAQSSATSQTATITATTGQVTGSVTVTVGI